MKQAKLPLRRRCGWGGRRAGAGRPKQKGAGVSHRRRPELDHRHPVHVTTRLKTVRGLREKGLFRVVRNALAAGCHRDGFRLVEFSVQSNHFHFICEAPSKESLSRGLQALLIRVARAVNRQLRRTGRVFADRYHGHVLVTPSQVRNALAYVLNNARRHAAQHGRAFDRYWVDPCSSAPRFFKDQSGVAAGMVYDAGPWEFPAARTWLLRAGWRRAGPVRVAEVPKGR